ncbi:MAG: TrkH family potassium uptake protein [Planctomycetota bacterium]|jgi:trk system potassium uptake protein TrkH|nr:TrkH family potassium uptake protein [Planctomycetota bacterium]
MNLRAVAWLLGRVTLLLAVFLLVPAGVAQTYGEAGALRACLLSAGAATILGLAVTWIFRGSVTTRGGRPDYYRREGLAVVGLAWLVGGIVGALPYLLSGVMASPVDALFESVSGFTTTGSTILSPEGIDGLPRSIAFWRSFTHWLGGFGIVMVFVVLFPTGGRSLFRSEIPGIAREAGMQRVRDSALALLRIYLAMSGLEFILLYLAGMSWFDSALHTFGTIATGGFSNHSQSIAWFGSWKIELIIGVFMFAAGINFAVYDLLLRAGPRSAWRRLVSSTEVRTYVGLVLGSSLLIAFILWSWGGGGGDPQSDLPDYRGFWQALRHSSFQVICMETSTGYGTADFDRWPQITRVWLMMLALVGACAGSTGGGLKVIRLVIVAKAALMGVRRFIRPRAIHDVRIDEHSLEEGVVASVTGYFALWILIFVAGTVFLAAFGVGTETAATAVLATLNNIGPGLAQVGPSMNFGAFPDPVKGLLTLFMILGRLEFYAVVALFVPGFWRR